MIQIIHVTLELDIDNRGIGLLATVVAAFPRETNGEVASISLVGRIISYLVNRVDRYFACAYIVITDWAEAFAHAQVNGKLSLSYMKRVIHLADHQVSAVQLSSGIALAVQRRLADILIAGYHSPRPRE